MKRIHPPYIYIYIYIYKEMAKGREKSKLGKIRLDVKKIIVKVDKTNTDKQIQIINILSLFHRKTSSE